MSKFEPVVIVDSSDSEREGSCSKTTRALIESRASVCLLDPISIFPVASASVNNADSTWVSGTRVPLNASEHLQRVRSVLLASSSSSDTDTETEMDFSTPPIKTAVKAHWENTKMGEDVGVSSKTIPHSPPYDPFGPTIDGESDVSENEKKKQEKDDFQFAVYLDMDLNGRSMKATAQKRIKQLAEEEEKEQPPKKKDRSEYWKKRHLKEKQLKIIRQTPHFNLRQNFIQQFFCGVKNFHRTYKQGPHDISFKRAVIPNSRGAIQHDLIVSSGKFFHRIVDDKVVQILPNENGQVSLNNDQLINSDVVFAATFPEGVFPA